ncbi:MAG: hypothetical protein RLZZ241_155 [Bacteroidota bacterium]
MFLVALLFWATTYSQHLAKGPEDSNVVLELRKCQTMLEALKIADLQEVLQHSGPFTVFAPTNAAFHQIENTSFSEWLKPEYHQKLRTLLTYHIVAGRLTASAILRALARGKGAARFTTVQGEELLATLDGSDIVLTDCSGNQARIVAADNNQNNLVFHEIDKVILPEPLFP